MLAEKTISLCVCVCECVLVCVRDRTRAYRFWCLRVCLSCERCRQSASGQLSFVWGLVACWQSQSLRITFPPGSLSLRHKPKDRHRRQADGGPILFRAISSSPPSRLNNTYSVLQLHEKLLIPILGFFSFFFFYNVQYMLNGFYDLYIHKTPFKMRCH